MAFHFPWTLGPAPASIGGEAGRMAQGIWSYYYCNSFGLVQGVTSMMLQIAAVQILQVLIGLHLKLVQGVCTLMLLINARLQEGVTRCY